MRLQQTMPVPSCQPPGAQVIGTLPRLDELLANPAQIDDLAPHAAGALVVQVSGLLVRLGARLASAPAAANGHQPLRDRLFLANEAAPLLGFTTKYLYAKASTFPFYIDVNGRPRFSEQGIQAYLRAARNPGGGDR